MISMTLPKTGPIFSRELNSCDPFCTLPEIEPGNDQSDRIAMLGSNGLTIMRRSKKHVLLK